MNADQTFRGESNPRPSTSSGVSEYHLLAAMQSVQNAADRPVSTKKTQIAHGVQGARLSSGSMRVKPSGSGVSPRQAPRIVDPKSPYAVYDPSTRTFIHKQDAMDIHRELSQHDETPHPPQQRASLPPPSPARNTVQRAPTPPPQYVQRAPSPIPQERDRTATPIQLPANPEPRRDTSPTPHPKSQAQAKPILARQSSEDYAEADITHPAEANPSRKLEYHLPEPRKIVPESPISPNQDSPYPRVGTPVIPAPNHPGPIRGDRNSSLSPPRNAHFAAMSVDLSNGVIHQPPPRSVSPAKSALKPSPSVSRRNSSPMANNGRAVARGAPSEASDTMSEDGSKRKKKSVRVSFDEEPVIAGVSAYTEAETPSSPTGLSVSRWSSTNQEQNIDEVMKPRPALPSFGSIREKSRRSDQDEVPEKVTETVSSSMSTSVGSIGEASNDHALGGILAQDFANKNASLQSSLDPLPPEVTSVEGSGYVSDSDQSDVAYDEAPPQDNPGANVKPGLAQSISELEPKTLTTPAESRAPVLEVPMIAIQPASPSPMEKAEPKFQRPFVPGGWNDDESESEEKGAVLSRDTSVIAIGDQEQGRQLASPNQEDESSDDNSSVYSDAYEDLSEDGGFASIDAVVESPVVEPPSGLMFSKYAESSQVVPPKSTLRQEVSGEAEHKQHADADGGDVARQQLSGLSDARKEQNLEKELAESAIPTVPAIVPVVQVPQPKKAKTPILHAQIESEAKSPKPPQMSRPSQSSAQPRKSALKKTTATSQATSPEPQMRKTMRANAGSDYTPSSATETHMRKSMRASTGSSFTSSSDTHMRKSMRSNEPITPSRGTPGLAASRHSMPLIDMKPPKGALQKKNIPAAMSVARPQSQIATGSVVVPKARASAPAYDSDSDASASSFQRQRPRASQGDGGRYSMRSSMRSGPAPTMRPSPTMRPISPPMAASPPPAALRKSMRPSSPSVEPTTVGGLRSSKFSLRSLSPAGRFRPPKSSTDDMPPLPTHASSKKASNKVPTFSKPPKTKAPAASVSKTRFKSRFVDSSDSDDDDRPRRFQSRFADSDDDEDFELPAGLAPVRGIPRKAGEEDGDSTDLEDEVSDNEVSSEKLPAKDFEKTDRVVTGTTNGQGALFAAGSLRNSKHAPELPSFETGKKPKGKRGFFGLGKKKTPAPQAADLNSEQMPIASTDIPFPPAHRNRGSRPLTPIGEDKSIEAAEPPPSRSPKLQRRSTPQWGRSASDSWPLPQPPKIGEETRPQSADGVIPRRTSLRPTLNKRNSSQISTARSIIDPKSGKEITVGRSGKKKKFQGLRRVFGLND